MLQAIRNIIQSNTSNRGVTLVEILIVSAIIALMAATSFPVYKIIQQREKERRLKRILREVNSAIGGCKSQRSNKIFIEGYRNYIISKGQAEIEAKNPNPADYKKAMQNFIKDGTNRGLFYPLTPSHLEYTPQDYVNAGTVISIATNTPPPALDPQNDYVHIEIKRRFLRKIPPHPFASWYPGAHWVFKPAVPAGAPAASDTAPWTPLTAVGVIQMKSKGAGYALDGSNTDDWE
ncbi:MAG: hypothetical protein Kow0029_22470 [Candidatus Rifleibacteriota bacterium]